MKTGTDSKKCVLIVDDEMKILNFSATALKIAGYEVKVATSGQEALQLVAKEKPDVMVLDLIMPVMDGFEVLKKLRAFSSMPVIVFSAMGNTYERAVGLGCNDYLAKPFKPKELITKIEAVLDHNRT